MRSAERWRRSRLFPLALRARRTPAAPALVWHEPRAKAGATASGAPGEGRLSYAELERLTRDAAGRLLARGAAAGERVALLLPPGPAYPVALLALQRAGCVAVPLSTRLPAGSIPALLAQVGCRRLIVSPEAAPRATAGLEVVDPALFRPDGTPVPPGSHGLPEIDAAAPATIVFTSGSTGVPKAAVHSLSSHWASAVGANRNLPLRPGDRWLLSLPLWHVGGLAVIFRCIQGGAALAIPGAGEPLADAVRSLGVTHLSLVATQLRRLLDDPRGRETLRSLKAVLLGGGPLPAPLLEEAAACGARLVASYGSTETASQASATRLGDPPAALRTAGRALPFREIALDREGEILVRGRTLFLGYLEGGEIRPGRDERGWFHTGDLGRRDEAGRLVVEGRRDNMFIAGGENVHPEEIERALAGYPGVVEAVVVPVPDREFGARPAAFLRTETGDLPDPAAVGLFLRRLLPGFKLPARYLRWPEIEAGIKPNRKALAELARRSRD